MLERFVAEFCLESESIRADKRYLANNDMFITGCESERHGTLVFVKDTSGSIDTDTLRSCVAVVQSASSRLRPRRLVVIDADAEVCDVQEYGPDDDIPCTAKGRGGTDFRPAFNHITEHYEDTRAVIYMTDGYGTFPEEEPDVPTVWLSYGIEPEHYPFGDAVNIKDVI